MPLSLWSEWCKVEPDLFARCPLTILFLARYHSTYYFSVTAHGRRSAPGANRFYFGFSSKIPLCVSKMCWQSTLVVTHLLWCQHDNNIEQCHYKQQHFWVDRGRAKAMAEVGSLSCPNPEMPPELAETYFSKNYSKMPPPQACPSPQVYCKPPSQS